MNKQIQAAQLRKAIQLFAQTISDESVMMELSDIYPTWESLVEKGSMCPAGTICRYGLNADGETQLYSFVSDYAPVGHYSPDADITHYKKIGFNEGGVPIWTQPFGSTDAYMKGDVVSHNGKTWESSIDNNVWEPGVHGWVERAK